MPLVAYETVLTDKGVTAGIRQIDAEFAKTEKNAKKVESSYKLMARQFKLAGDAMTAAGKTMAVALTAPILAVTGVGIAFNAMQEQAHIAFTTMLGDGAKASAFLNELKDFAAKTPFEFPDLVKAAQRLMAMGFAANDVRPLLTAVGNAVAGLGGGAAEIDRVTLALGQMQGRGKIATQEMNQLTEVGIPAWAMLAKGMNLTESALRDMVEKGAVPAGRAVEILVAGMNDKFGGMMEKQATTFTGLVSTIADESRFLAGELTSGLFNVIKEPAMAVSAALHEVRVAMSGWGDGTKTAIAGIGLLLAAIGPALLILGSLAGSVSRIALFLKDWPALWASARTALSALTGPVGILVTVIAGLLAHLIYIRKEATGALLYALSQLVSGFAKVVGAASTLAHALGMSGLGASLGEMQFRIEETAMSLDQMSNDALATKKATAELTPQVRDAAVKLSGMSDATNEAAEAQKKFRQEVDSVKNSVTGSVSSSRSLNQALVEMKAAGVNSEVILDALGKQAMDTANDLRALGQAVPQAINEVAMAQVGAMVQAIIATNNKHLQEVEAAAVESNQRALDKMSDAFTEAKAGEAEGYKRYLEHLYTLDAEAQQKLLDTANKDYEAMLDMERRLAGARAANADKRVADEERVAKAGAGIIDHFAGDMSKMFTDAIGHGKSFWEAFKSFGTNAIASITDTFISTMIKGALDQFKSKFGELQADITAWIGKNKGLIGMTAGGAAIGGAVGGTSGAVAGGAAGAAVSMAMTGNWIGAAVAGITAIGAAITGMIGKGRKMADEFVNSVQNPMGDAVKDLFKSLEDAKRMGTLTLDQTRSARVAFEDMWSKFQSSAASMGVVGQQAMATMTPFVASWRQWLTDLDTAAEEMQHMSEVMSVVNRVMGAADGWQVMEQGIQTLMDTGMDWAAILDIMGGDVRSMAHNMELLGIAIPPAMQSILDAGDAFDAAGKQAQEAAEATQKATQEAAEALQRNKDRLRDVEEEIADVRQQTADAILHKFEYLEGEIENSLGSIDKWRDEITDLNKEITDAATKLHDNTYWMEEYNSLIKDQADEVKRLLDLRKSTEERIGDLALQVERDRFAAAIEAAKASHDETALAKLERNLDFFEANVRKSERAARLAELNRLQNELPQIIQQQEAAAVVMQQTATAAIREIDARRQELQNFIDTKAAERVALQASIAVEQARIVLLNADKAATQALMDIMGITRLSEIDKINLSITALVERGIALVDERSALGDLLDVAQDGIDVFNDLASAIGEAILAASQPPAAPKDLPPVGGISPTNGTPTGPPGFFDQIDALRRANGGLPELDTGLVRVPRTMAAILHQDEAVLTAPQARDWRSGNSGTTKIENNTPITIHVHGTNDPDATADRVVKKIERLLNTNQGSLGHTVRKATNRPR